MKAFYYFLLLSLVLFPVTGYAEKPRQATIRHASVTISGYDLYYNISGHGPVTIIFLHGLFADKSHWTALAGYMDEHAYTCIAPDLPCYGQSRAYPVRYAALDLQVEVLHDFIMKLSLKKVHLAGSSLGGMLALAYARRYPDQTASLCLMGAPAGLFPWSDDLTRKFSAGANPFIPQNRDEYRFEMKCLFAAPPTVSDEYMDKAVSDYNHNMARYASLFNIVSISMYNFSAAPMAGYRCPVIMILGKEENVFCTGDIGKVTALMPRGEYILIPDTGHLPMLERPALAGEMYNRFLGKEKDRK